jgi:adenylosuccinate synthase
MKNAIITVGLGFGDEGKGAAVDFLTRSLHADLVVRYSGGGQAGHNVELADGRRHTFSQFGAGTLAGARTYLGPRMIISPTTMVPEADHLSSLGAHDPWTTLTAHPDCLISTGYHIWMNRLREIARGTARHGSCGLGIGETRSYWLRYGLDAVFAQDLADRRALSMKLALVRDRFLIEMQELARLDPDLSNRMHHTMPCQEAEVLQLASQRLTTSRALPNSDTVIFEGAQGTLLDEWKGFHPFTTWSTVTPLHAWEMLADYPEVQTSVIGITRAYATRHGEGPFPTACAKMSAEMTDPGNPGNDWQGKMRFGPLDMVLTEYAARVCQIDGIFVGGLDQLPPAPRIVTEYQQFRRLEEPTSLDQQQRITTRLESAVPIDRPVATDELLGILSEVAPIVGTGHGATAGDRELRSTNHGSAPS